MSELIYIASPYTHDDPKKVVENFEGITKYVAIKVAAGEVLISPITYGHTLLDYKEMPSSWEFWQNFCFSLLINCDRVRVVKMPGWDESTGVAEEVSFARGRGIPVEYVEFNIEENE